MSWLAKFRHQSVVVWISPSVQKQQLLAISLVITGCEVELLLLKENMVLREHQLIRNIKIGSLYIASLWGCSVGGWTMKALFLSFFCSFLLVSNRWKRLDKFPPSMWCQRTRLRQNGFLLEPKFFKIILFKSQNASSVKNAKVPNKFLYLYNFPTIGEKLKVSTNHWYKLWHEYRTMITSH